MIWPNSGLEKNKCQKIKILTESKIILNFKGLNVIFHRVIIGLHSKLVSR
jgi:hypothetical protein